MAVAKNKAQGAKKAKKVGSAKPAKRKGDVLGLSGARPPGKPIKSGVGAGKRRKPKGLDPNWRRRERSLPLARVRG